VTATAISRITKVLNVYFTTFGAISSVARGVGVGGILTRDLFGTR